MSRPTTPQPSQRYLKLVNRFPLVPLEDDRHLAEAQEVIDSLLQRNLDAGESKYLDVLTDLVAAYEAAHHPMPAVSGADMLRHLMEARSLTQTLLASETGIAASTVSAVLSGKRDLAKPHITALAKYFDVSPAAFL